MEGQSLSEAAASKRISGKAERKGAADDDKSDTGKTVLRIVKLWEFLRRTSEQRSVDTGEADDMLCFASPALQDEFGNGCRGSFMDNPRNTYYEQW